MHADRRLFWWWLGAGSIFEIASYMLFHSQMMTAGWIVAGVILAIVAWRRPLLLVSFSIAEIVIGGKGYLLFIHVGSQTLSVRLLLFVMLIIRFGPGLIRSWKRFWNIAPSRPLVWLAIWVGLMTVFGIARGNSSSNVFLDANAFAALAYLPLWWIGVQSTLHWRSMVWAVVVAGATVVGLKSLVVVYLFGHQFSWLPSVYAWIRQTGIGEITLINQNVFRVFFQGQVMDLLVFITLFAAWVRGTLSRWLWFPMIAAALGAYISLSRSFWLGAVVGLIVLIILVLQRQPKLVWKVTLIVPILGVVWALNTWAINFPTFSGGQVNPVLARLQSADSVQASTARVNQIRPLLRAIRHHPVFGSGFGTAVTYFSTDPRVHGWRTTTAFELGYLDLWLKIGIVGLVLYGWWVVKLWTLSLRKDMIGLSVALVVLMAVHLTSPYLNHPLGLGWLALTGIWLYD